mmetsp:Transcript_17153/g.40302  ORF Transcript_17153/g.40302 Transcript_17153/m.40302 type:complete len:247 (+) Transcript_17153:58-798(+)
MSSEIRSLGSGDQLGWPVDPLKVKNTFLELKEDSSCTSSSYRVNSDPTSGKSSELGSGFDGENAVRILGPLNQAVTQHKVWGKADIPDTLLALGGTTEFMSSESDGTGSSQQMAELEEDQLLSKGSAEHHLGNCKPCHFFKSKVGCKQGAECLFCHLAHEPRPKPPGKAQRARAKKQVRQLVASAQQGTPGEAVRQEAQKLAEKSSYMKTIVQHGLREFFSDGFEDKSGPSGATDSGSRQKVVMSL